MPIKANVRSFINKLVNNEVLMMTPRVETCRQFNYKIKINVFDRNVRF